MFLACPSHGGWIRRLGKGRPLRALKPQKMFGGGVQSYLLTWHILGDRLIPLAAPLILVGFYMSAPLKVKLLAGDLRVAMLIGLVWLLRIPFGGTDFFGDSCVFVEEM